MYSEHEPQVQVNHDEKGIRFGAIVTSYVERFLFQESTPYQKESGVSNALEHPQEEGGQQRRRRLMLDLSGTQSGRFKSIVFIHIVCCRIACLLLTIFIHVLLFVVIVFL